MYERDRERTIRKAREALRECQQDRDAFMRLNPGYSEALRVFNERVKVLNDTLDAIIRGRPEPDKKVKAVRVSLFS